MPRNPNNIDSRPKTNPVKIALIILIVSIAVADLIMISELPHFIRDLHTGGRNSGLEHAPSHEKKELDDLDGSAKDQMAPMMKAANESVHLFDFSSRHGHRFEK